MNDLDFVVNYERLFWWRKCAVSEWDRLAWKLVMHFELLGEIGCTYSYSYCKFSIVSFLNFDSPPHKSSIWLLFKWMEYSAEHALQYIGYWLRLGVQTLSSFVKIWWVNFLAFMLWLGSLSKIYPAVTYAATQHQGRLFWITCKRLNILREASCLQVIQNSTPSVAGWQQCDIRIWVD